MDCTNMSRDKYGTPTIMGAEHTQKASVENNVTKTALVFDLSKRRILFIHHHFYI
jgi:hypothetical protein